MTSGGISSVLFLKKNTKKKTLQNKVLVFFLIRLPAVCDKEYMWFTKRAKGEKDGFCISCCLLAHISRTEVLPFFPNLYSFWNRLLVFLSL